MKLIEIKTTTFAAIFPDFETFREKMVAFDSFFADTYLNDSESVKKVTYGFEKIQKYYYDSNIWNENSGYFEIQFLNTFSQNWPIYEITFTPANYHNIMMSDLGEFTFSGEGATDDSNSSFLKPTKYKSYTFKRFTGEALFTALKARNNHLNTWIDLFSQFFQKKVI